MTISFGGLASGIDTNALIDQLVALERIPAEKLAARQADANDRKSIVTDLISKLTALRSARKSVDTPSEIHAVTATSSDEGRVRVTGSGAAQPAQLALRVDALATGQTNVSSMFQSGDQLVPGAGMLGIKVGDSDEVVVEFTSIDTLAGLAQRISEQVPGVNAQVLNTNGGVQLALSSRETGAANAFTLTEGGTSLGFLLPDSQRTTAQDARFTLNNIEMTRSSNTVGDAVAGLTFELRGTHALADADTQIAVARDPKGSEERVKSLVDAFNAVADVVSAQTSYNGVTRGADTLFGDGTVRSLQRGLSDLATGRYPNGAGTISLGQIGIQLDRNGRLTLDSTKFADAIATDPAAVESLLTGENGLGTAIDDLVNQYTAAGDGFLTAKKTALTTEASRYDTEIERIELRATKVGDMLHDQFTRLESLISSLQSQQSALSALFG